MLHRRLAIALAAFVFLPGSALAGAVLDGDGDLVPDQFDNCSTRANGPNEISNQVDTDLDGYGNRCDPDLDQSCTVTALDFGRFLSCFGTTCPDSGPDFDGSGTVTALDFGVFLTYFSAGLPPGPSGLVCADCTLRTDLGDTPCLP